MDGDRFRRSVFYAFIVVCVLCGPFLYGYSLGLDASRLRTFDPGFSPSHEQHLSSSTTRTKDFHFLIPATGPKVHLCKLLLTGAILQYPEPILLGWNHRGVFDGAKSHLFKITETASYLRSLPASADDDLVFILDAYDIWLQLRPSTLITRYYALLRKHDDVLREQGILGHIFEPGVEVRSKLLFGADKFPGPPSFQESFVWAAPNSTFPDDVFGNQTDRSDIDHKRPKYLNSGTILGPVKDMRDFFEATEDAIMREAADDDQKLAHSDQAYFGRVWGPQEVARQKLREGQDGYRMNVPDGAHMPDTTGMRTEYGVCLDQEHELFQLASGWFQWLTKLKFNGKESPVVTGEVGQGIASKQWTLPDDVLSSEGPYAALEPDELPGHPTGWENVSLGANAVSRQPYGLLHFTANKFLREEWWPDLWFHPHGELLQKAARRKQVARDVPEVFAEVNGISYKQTRTIFKDHEKAGAWRATGEYVSWHDMCANEQTETEFYTPKSST